MDKHTQPLSEATASVACVRAALAASERLGLRPDELLSSLGTTLPDDGEARVPLACLITLHGAIQSRLQARLGGESQRTFVAIVRDIVLRRIADGACCVEDVARELGMSARTVQCRLESEGTTFGALIDDTRRERALACLQDPRIAIKEAAWRVGFSEPSTFYRAFRRWTGSTPADYRRTCTT